MVLGNSNITAVVQKSDGSTAGLSLYVVASAGVGTYLPCAKSSIALSTDSVDIVVKQTVHIIDIATVQTQGVVQLWEDGEPTSVIFDLANHLNTNTARPKLGIKLVAGHIYRFKMLSAAAA